LRHAAVNGMAILRGQPVNTTHNMLRTFLMVVAWAFFVAIALAMSAWTIQAVVFVLRERHTILVDVDKVRPGMHFDQVVKVLGLPTVQHTSPVLESAYPQGIAAIVNSMQRDHVKVREWKSREWFVLIGFDREDLVECKVIVSPPDGRPAGRRPLTR
jgi:hypothetical protein